MKHFSPNSAVSRRVKLLAFAALAVFAAVVHVGFSGLSLQTAIAATSPSTPKVFNTDPRDYDTLRSSNYTRFPDSLDHWESVTDADAGNTVSLAVYYHNSTEGIAENTHISMSVPTGKAFEHRPTGQLWADNFETLYGSALVRISTEQSLEYIPGSAQWYPNQAITPSPFPFGQSGDEVMTSGGVNIGSIESGWEFQGSVVARFKVSDSTTTPPPTDESVVDITANGSQGPVALASGESFTVNWVSGNATNCNLLMDGSLLSGVASNGSAGPIASGHPFYPQDNGSRTFTISCDGLSGVVSDSVVISRSTVPPTPDTPLAPTISAQTASSCGGSIVVSWSSVSGIAKYNVYRDGAFLAEVTTTSFEDTGLQPETTHSYVVRSVGSNAVESSDSNTVSATASVACPVPQSSVDITANGSQGPVTLTEGELFTVEWISQNATNCSVSLANIFTSGVASNGSLGPIGPSHAFYPPAGGSHTFVITCDGLSGVVTDSVVVKRPDVSNPPSAPTITAVTSTSCGGKVLVSWSAVSGATSYKIFRSDTQIAEVSNTLSYTDGGLTPGASYIYKVKAVNATGESAFSNADVGTASAECLVPPPAPSILAFTDTACGGQIVISWNTVGSADFYKVYRNDVKVAEVTGTSYIDTGLTPGASYSYVVKAENEAGLSPASNRVSATASAACVTIPAAPEVSASTGTACGGVINLTWTAISGAGSYNVYRNGILIATEFDTSYTDTGLTPGASYSYTVKAENSAGQSPSSNVASATASAACVTIPEAPVLSGSTGTACGGTIALSWTTPQNAAFYKVFRDGVQIATTTASNLTDSGLSDDTVYTYTVVASNSAGDSVASNTSTVRSSEKCPLNNPTVSLIATPATIFKGQNSTLAWTSTNADSCSAAWTASTATSGSQVVSPEITTTYSITCVKGAKTATDTATITVVEAPQCVLPTISSALGVTGKVGEAFSYTLTATSSSTSTISYSFGTSTLPAGLSISGNTISGTPTTSGTFTFTVSATNICGVDTETLTVTINPNGGGGSNNPTVNLTATPATIFKGQNSTLAWTSTNTDSCSAPWTTATSTSGSLLVSPATTTVYSITCEKGSKSATDSVTVTVVDAPQCSIPVISSSLSATGKVGEVFSYTFTANPTSTSTVFTIGTSTLPAGLSFSGNTISGTPTASGTFNIPATVSDNCGFSTDYILVITINPSGNGSNNPTVDLTANPETIDEGESSVLSWTSTNADSCSASWTTATSTSGSATVTPSETTTYSITCVKGSQSATDSAIVSVDEDNGGGGGGSSRSRSGSRRSPTVLGEELSCEYLKDYLRIDWVNDPVEVIKLQVFLKELEGFDSLQVTRIFDEQTFDAVAIFQERYFDDILRPWGHDRYTGFVYILTKKKVNEIFCQKAFPLTGAQEEEIEAFRAFLESLRAQGVDLPSGFPTDSEAPLASTTPNLIGSLDDFLDGLTDGVSEDGSGGLLSNLNLRNAATAIFAGPSGWDESLQSIVIFFLILATSYVASQAIVARKNKGIPSSEEKVKIEKIFTFVLCLVVATILAFTLAYYPIILPLLILIIVLSVTLLYLSVKRKTPQTLIVLPGKTEPIEEPKE